MNALDSECRSGCDSGWTLYFEHSSLSPNVSHSLRDEHKHHKRAYKEESNEEEQQEEEDLSMVSDASSGPPHLPEDEGYFNDDNGCSFPASMAATLAKNGRKRQKIKQLRHRENQEPTDLLDDTASSPVMNFSWNNFTLTNNQPSMESVVDFSQGLSETYFERKSTFQDHFGFSESSSLSANQLKNNQWFEGKRFRLR